MGTAGLKRCLVLMGKEADMVLTPLQNAGQMRMGLPQLQGDGRVEDILRGGAPMNMKPAAGSPQRSSNCLSTGTNGCCAKAISRLRRS